MLKNDPYLIHELEQNFFRRNIAVLWFDAFIDAKAYLLENIPLHASVGIGHSKTLQNMGILEALRARGNLVFDKELGATEQEVRKIKRNALLADCYLSGANAVSVDGRIVNIDHSGNRVAALAYGPDRVFVVVGKKNNKNI